MNLEKIRRSKMGSERRQRFWKRNKSTRCYYCNKRVLRDLPQHHPNKATIDHILPVSKGGTHALVNLVICCYPCNQEKDNMIYE